MKVTYSNGNPGQLISKSAISDLYVQNTSSKSDWKKLKKKMKELDISEFENPLFKKLGISRVSIDFVNARIASL